MAASAASITAVQKAYVAYYGRPADPAGLTYWSERLDSIEGGFSQMIEAFGSSEEATALFGSLANDAKINTIYQQIFGRDADAEGLAFYSAALTAGTMSAVTIAQNIIDGATGDDSTIVTNKLTAAQAFSDYLSTNDVEDYTGNDAAESGRDWLSSVDETTASVTAASGAIAAVVAALEPASPNPGQTFVLTMGDDELVGTSGDDIFNGTSVQVDQDNDDIDGGAGNDTVNISVKAGFTVMQIDNVETINFNTETFTTPTIDLSEIKEGRINLNAVQGFATDIEVLNADDLEISLGSQLVSATIGDYDGGIIHVGSAMRTLTLDTTDSREAFLELGTGVSSFSVNSVAALQDLSITAVSGQNKVTLDAAAALTGDIVLNGGVTLVAGLTAVSAATVTGGVENTIEIAAGAADGTAFDLDDISVTVRIDSDMSLLNAVDKSVVIVTASTVSITTDNDGGDVAVSLSADNVAVIKGASADSLTINVGSNISAVAEIRATTGDTTLVFGGDSLTVTLIGDAAAGNNEALIYFSNTGAVSVTTSQAMYFDGSDATGAIGMTLQATATNDIVTGAGNDVITVGTAASIANTSISTGAGNDLVTLSLLEAVSADVYVNLGAGDDQVTFGTGFDAMTAGSNLVIVGGDGSDKINLQNSAAIDFSFDLMDRLTLVGIETISARGSLTFKSNTLSGQDITVTSSASTGDVFTVELASGATSLDLTGMTYTGFDSVDVLVEVASAGLAINLSDVKEELTFNIGGAATPSSAAQGFRVDMGGGADFVDFVAVSAELGGTLTLGAGADDVRLTSSATSLDIIDLDDHLIITDFNVAEDQIAFVSGSSILTVGVGSAIDVSAVTTPTDDVVSVYLSAGMMTLVGGGVGNVLTLADYYSAALLIAAGDDETNETTLGFEFDGDTWLISFASSDVINVVQLEGVTGANLQFAVGSKAIDING
jgi:S-layer protein